MKYINTAMAIEALRKGLDVWIWHPSVKAWTESTLSNLTYSPNTDNHFAIGEMPTSPPRKMIEIDGVVMPAPIMRAEDLPDKFFILFSRGTIEIRTDKTFWAEEAAMGNAFATEADAIAARDARKLILERALERAK